jgi:hypothetical protein
VETERRERGRDRRREGGKEAEEKYKGEETGGKRQKGRDREERIHRAVEEMEGC